MVFHPLQGVLDQCQDVVGIIDRNYRYIFTNQTYRRYWGKSREEVSGVTVSDVVGSEAFDSSIQGYIQRCLAGENVRFDQWLDFPGAGRRLMDVNYSPFRDEAGEILGVFLIARDITERNELQSRIQDDRDRFDGILNSLKVGLVVCSPEMIIEWTNRQMREFFPHGSLIGQKCFRAFGGGDEPCDECPALLTLETGASHSSERYHEATGRWYAQTVVPIREAGGLRLLGHVVDITAQKRVEAAAREGERRFRDLFEDVNMIAVQGYDQERRVVYWNPASEDLYGYSREEAMGQYLEDLIIPDGMHEAVKSGHEVWLNGGPAIPAGELELIHKEGSPVPVYSSHVMQETASGEKLMYCLDVNLSEVKRIHNQLVVAKEEAEAANQAKTEFLANMSHEIRTPLNGIQGMLTLMLTTELDKDQKEFAQAGVESAARLNRLLSDILDLSRVEAGMMTMENVPFNLPDMIFQLLALFSLSYDQESVSLSCHVEDEVPQYVVGDGARLQQVLINLVGNGLKYTSSGEVRVDVSLLSPVKSGVHRIYIAVSDTGTGIPEDMIDSLFEPFVQGSRGLARQYQGAGLGLSICRRLVNFMGGNMSAESVVGVGTVFHLVIPFGYEGTESVDIASGSGENLDTVVGLHVLLAEDDHVNSIVGKRLLQNAGCSVVAVTDGLKAVEMIRKHDFDAVFMDVQMPGMDGIDATRSVRLGIAGASRRNIPIYALTAYSMAGDRERFLEAGMDGFIPKPVEMKDIVRSLREAAQKKYAPDG